jgi:cytochrome c-550 PedF
MRSFFSLVLWTVCFTVAFWTPNATLAEEAPQDVDTTGLEPLGKEWRNANPYDMSNARAVEVGVSAFAQNCARCHGIGAVSGGLAPDLRFLPPDEEGDEIFAERVRNGSTRDGRVLMPPFEDALRQETLWAIRTWLETVHEE